MKYLLFIKKYGVIFVFIIIPIAIIKLSGKNEQLGRFVALFIAIMSSVPVLLFYSLYPKSNFLRKGAKLKKAEYSTIRPYIIFCIRIFFLFIAIGLLFYIYIPFIQDIIHLSRDSKPKIVQGKVIYVSEPFILTGFFAQTITLDGIEGQKETYLFLYPLKPRIKKGTLVKLVYLPQSKLVLEEKR